MSEPSDTKPDPTSERTAEEEPKLAKDETELATNPKSTTEGESKEEASSPTAKPTYTKMASNVASGASAAAAGVTSSVFSMFGGGAKKEKKEEPEDDTNEPSGSSKAVKKEGEDEVGFPCPHFRPWALVQTGSDDYSRKKQRRVNQMPTSSRSFISPRRLRPRQMKSSRSRHLRCVPSSSSSTVTAESGRSVGRVMSDC